MSECDMEIGPPSRLWELTAQGDVRHADGRSTPVLLLQSWWKPGFPNILSHMKTSKVPHNIHQQHTTYQQKCKGVANC